MMAFGQYILEMEVLVTEALCNAVDCKCSSENLEPQCKLTPYAYWLGKARCIQVPPTGFC